MAWEESLPEPSPARRGGAPIAVADLQAIAEDWIRDAMCRRHSSQTIASRRLIIDKLLWWLNQAGCTFVGLREIRAFLAYVGAPAPAGGRWGNPTETRQNSARTVHTYWERLRTLFNWAVNERMIPDNPMATLRPPCARRDSIQPFSEQQVEALLIAAERSRYPVRNRAIVLFLLDTGVRASELCGLKLGDLDLTNGKATVLGKGGKRRPVYFAQETGEALQRYLDQDPRGQNDPLFRGERRSKLTRSGLKQIVERLGKVAGISGVRCSPHTFRHTFAIWALRNGMHLFSLQALLGHEDLTMTRRYVALANADVERQHRQNSPVRRLTGAQASPVLQ
jgi:integrase/recombinase XerC/integrase/recombinase XerD